MNRNKLRQPSDIIILKDGKTIEQVTDLHRKQIDEENGREKVNYKIDFSKIDLGYVDLSNDVLGNANLTDCRFKLR